MHSRHVLPALLLALLALAAWPAPRAAAAPAAADSAGLAPAGAALQDTAGLIRSRLRGFRPPTARAPLDTSRAVPGTRAADTPAADTLAADTTGASEEPAEPSRGPTLVSAADSAVAFPIYARPESEDPRFRPGASSDSTRRAAIAYPRPRPYTVMLRSALVPGWGQLTNGKWWKAILVVGLEGYLAGSAVGAGRDVSRAQDSLRAAGSYADSLSIQISLQSARDRRAGFIWWTVGAVGLSMLDAYVDAHFKNFDVTPIAGNPRRPGEAFLGLQLAWRH
jgi:hypothetical protein